MMIIVQGCLDAVISMMAVVLWSDEDDGKQLNKFRQAGVQNKVLWGLLSFLPLTLTHKPPQQVSYLLIVVGGASKTPKNSNKVYCANKGAFKNHREKMKQADTSPFSVAVRSDRGKKPHGPSKCSYSTFFLAYSEHWSQRANELDLAPFRRPQWLISSRQLSNKTCNKSPSSFFLVRDQQ